MKTVKAILIALPTLVVLYGMIVVGNAALEIVDLILERQAKVMLETCLTGTDCEQSWRELHPE